MAVVIIKLTHKWLMQTLLFIVHMSNAFITFQQFSLQGPELAFFATGVNMDFGAPLYSSTAKYIFKDSFLIADLF